MALQPGLTRGALSEVGPGAWPKGSSEAPSRYPQASCPDRQAEAAGRRGVLGELSEPRALRQAGGKWKRPV